MASDLTDLQLNYPKHLPQPGEVFNNLTIVGAIWRSKGKEGKRVRYVLCRCKCGKTKVIAPSQVRKGFTKSCGCMRGILISQNLKRILRTDDFPQRRLLAWYKGFCKKKGIPCDLTLSFLRANIFSPCFYCGSPPCNRTSGSTIKRKYRTFSIPEMTYSGLDKVDPSGGYTQDNVVPCCRFCNIAKRDFSQEEFISWIHKAHSSLLSKDYLLVEEGHYVI